MARAKPELRPCGIAPDLRFNPSRSLSFRQNPQSGRDALSISIRVTPQSLQHFRQIGNCQRQSGHIDPDESQRAGKERRLLGVAESREIRSQARVEMEKFREASEKNLTEFT